MQDRKKTQADIQGLQELRKTLDELCRRQAKWAPEDYDLKNARYPPREGRVTDLIAWRKGVTASGWESSDDEDEECEEGEEGEEGEEDEEDQEHQMDASKHGELEDILDKPVPQNNDGILLENTLEVQAAHDEIFGKDLNIIDTEKEVILEERQKEVVLELRCKEGTPAVEAKGEQASQDGAAGEREGKRQNASRILNSVAQHQQQMQQQMQKHEQKMQELEKQHKQKMQEREQQHEQQMQEVQAAHEQRRRQLLQAEYDELQLRVDAMRARQRDIIAEMEGLN
jgi:hypothetical protein